MRIFAAEWRHLLQHADSLVASDAYFQLSDNNYCVLLSPSEENTSYTNHMSFSDYSTLQYQPALQSYFRTYQPGFLGTADGRQIAIAINSYVLLFFNQYLKGSKSSVFSECQSVSKDTLLRCPNKQLVLMVAALFIPSLGCSPMPLRVRVR